jgi:hypothetical protein
MDAWWWVPIGLVAWFAVAVAAGLLLGPVLRYCSQAWETQSLRMGETPATLRESPRCWKQAS